MWWVRDYSDEGHLKKDCLKRRNGKGKKKVQYSDEEEDASTNLISEYDYDALVVSMDDPKELVGCSISWILDSSTSHHSHNVRRCLIISNLKRLEKSILRMARKWKSLDKVM